MRIDRGLFNWGVFLIALGGVPLLVQLERLDAGVAGDLVRLWPLILVGIGLGLVLRLTPLAWLGGALVAATFGILFGAALAGGVGGIGGFGGACLGNGEGETTSQSGLAGEGAFSLGIELTCGEVTVVREPAARWTVAATHGVDRPPIVEGSSTRLSVRPDYEGNGVFAVLDQTRNEWRIGVPTSSALSVGLTLNAASGALTLGPGPLETVGATLNAADARFDLAGGTNDGAISLGMTYNASSGTIVLPAETDVVGGITLNASSLRLCAGPETAIRIRSSATLSSEDYSGAGMEQSGDDAWQTPGYAAASLAVDLDISSTVSSVSVDRSGVCE